MSSGTFGERLKREREMRGVALEEVSSATRISTRFLEALENERWSDLPGGVFNRGFIRAVARYLGLDEESLIAEYALATNDRPEVAVWADGPVQAKPRLLPWILLLALAALGAAGWFGYQRLSPLVAAWRQPVPEPPKLSVQPAAPSGPIADAALSAATNGNAPAAAATSQNTATEPATLILKIEVAEMRKITVIADGKKVFDGRMRPGQSHRFEAKEAFDVSANIAGKVLLELNGQPMPALGVPNQPGHITLDRKDLRKSQGGPD